MYKIKFKGSFDDIEVADDIGINLMENMKKNILSDMVEIAGGVYHSKSIKAIQPSSFRDNSADKERNAEMVEKIDAEYARKREAQMKLSPEVRAKNISLFKLVWFAETGEQDAPEKVIAEVIKRQQKYFEDNPLKSEASPTCYKDLATKKRVNDSVQAKDYVGADGIARRCALELIKRILNADNVYNKNL